MMLENVAFTFKLNQVKKIIKEYNGREDVAFGNLKSDIRKTLNEIIALLESDHNRGPQFCCPI